MARNKLPPSYSKKLPLSLCLFLSHVTSCLLSIALKPQVKRVRTSPVGPSFESLDDDVTESTPPPPSCIETSYDAHRKPHVCLIRMGGAL